MAAKSATPATPLIGTLTGGFGRWVLIHKGPEGGYKTKTRRGDTIVRAAMQLDEVLPIVSALGYDTVDICAWLGQSAYPYTLGPHLRRTLPACSRASASSSTASPPPAARATPSIASATPPPMPTSTASASPTPRTASGSPPNGAPPTSRISSA